MSLFSSPVIVRTAAGHESSLYYSDNFFQSVTTMFEKKNWILAHAVSIKGMSRLSFAIYKHYNLAGSRAGS